MDEFLTTEELLAELKISRSTLYRLLVSGRLQAFQLHEKGSLRFRRSDIQSALRPWQASTLQRTCVAYEIWMRTKRRPRRAGTR